MEKVIKKNKKHIATILALCIAIIAMLGVVVGIWAATNQNITSTFNVNYSIGENIAAKVRTEKYVPNLDSNADGVEDGVEAVTKDSNNNDIETDENDYVVFNVPDETTVKDVNIGEVSLDPIAKKAYFYFTIESIMGDGFIRVLLNSTYETKKNIKVDVSYCNISKSSDAFNNTVSASEIADEEWTQAHYYNIPAGGFKIIRIALEVININRSAQCGGNFKINLEYSNVTGEPVKIDETEAYTTLTTTTTATDIKFLYAKEQPKTAVEPTKVSPMTETEKSIWTELVDTTLYVYSNYTIELPEDCSSLFAERTDLKSIDFTNIRSSNVVNMEMMFFQCENLATLDLSNFDTSNVETMMGMFGYCSNLKELNVSSFNTSNVVSFKNLFFGCSALTALDIPNFNTETATSLQGMFAKCSSLSKIDVSHFNTDNVTSMKTMFGECSMIKQLDLSDFDTKKVTDMSYMFMKCHALQSLDISSFSTEQVTTMYAMFYNCYALKELDLSEFNTEKVTDMSYMFYDCRKLTSLDVSNFNTLNVKNMAYMFYACSQLTSLDLSSFDTSNVDGSAGGLEFMFGYMSELVYLDISNFNTENVVNMYALFAHNTKLSTIVIGDGWTTANVTESGSMFANCDALPHFAENGRASNKAYAYAGLNETTGKYGYLTHVNSLT